MPADEAEECSASVAATVRKSWRTDARSGTATLAIPHSFAVIVTEFDRFRPISTARLRSQHQLRNACATDAPEAR